MELPAPYERINLTSISVLLRGDEFMIKKKRINLYRFCHYGHRGARDIEEVCPPLQSYKINDDHIDCWVTCAALFVPRLLYIDPCDVIYRHVPRRRASDF